MEKKDKAVIDVKRSLHIRLKTYASSQDRQLKEVTNEAIEMYLLEKEKEMNK